MKVKIISEIKKKHGYSVEMSKCDGVIRFHSNDKAIQDKLSESESVYVKNYSHLTIFQWLEEFEYALRAK